MYLSRSRDCSYIKELVRERTLRSGRGNPQFVLRVLLQQCLKARILAQWIPDRIELQQRRRDPQAGGNRRQFLQYVNGLIVGTNAHVRSEERRVGKECR